LLGESGELVTQDVVDISTAVPRTTSPTFETAVRLKEYAEAMSTSLAFSARQAHTWRFRALG
jgi:hypothetical protein